MSERQKDAGRRGDFPYYISIPYFQQITWEIAIAAPSLSGSLKILSTGTGRSAARLMFPGGLGAR
jgi:hypothetical protein